MTSTIIGTQVDWALDDNGKPVGIIDPTNSNRVIISTNQVGADGRAVTNTAPRPFLTAVACGNSIAAQCKHTGGKWNTNSDIHLASALAGSPLQFPRITATTRTDAWGVYGYSGQTLETINGDLATQFYTPIVNASVYPDLIVGLALLENDLGLGRSVAAMKKDVDRWIREAQTRYPGAMLLICTPRPSFSYDNGAKVLAYQQMRDYILSLDDGESIFASRTDAYENPSSPGTPLGTAAAQIYTDTTVHPNAKGALLNARLMAQTLKRIATVFKANYPVLSTNFALTGSATATGTNVSGTTATGVTHAGTAVSTHVLTAENPGVLVSCTVAPGVTDTASLFCGEVSYTGTATTQVSSYAKLEIVSGAENLKFLTVDPRIRDSSAANTYQYYFQAASGDAEPDFQNGDVLTFRTPPLAAPGANTITGVSNYIRPSMKAQGGTVVFRVIAQGVGILKV